MPLPLVFNKSIVSVHLPNSHQINLKSGSRISNDINTKSRSRTFLPMAFWGMNSLALFQLTKDVKSQPCHLATPGRSNFKSNPLVLRVSMAMALMDGWQLFSA